MEYIYTYMYIYIVTCYNVRSGLDYHLRDSNISRPDHLENGVTYALSDK